jgi:hypothetical protein
MIFLPNLIQTLQYTVFRSSIFKPLH